MRRYRTATVGEGELEIEAEEMLVGREKDSGKNRFRAVKSPVRFDDQTILLPGAVKELLDVDSGDRVSVIPFE